MSYCTQSDIELFIGPDDLVALADHDGDGVADPQVVERAIEAAGALIDSYLGVRYAVPVAGPDGQAPPALKARAVTLAVYFLRVGRDSVTEDVQAQYRRDVEWLREVVAGRVSLGVQPRPAEGPGAPSVRIQSQPRRFGRDEPL